MTKYMRALVVLVAIIAGASVAVAVILATAPITTTRTATVTTGVAVAPLASATPAPTCSSQESTMNCVLRTVAPPQLLSLTPGQTYGVDFGWSGVSALTAQRAGAKFGASYLSLDPTKNWTSTLVNAYHASGIATVAVWETTANRATEGYADGVSDARTAAVQAAAIGDSRTIFFAIDCDCTGSSILDYFKGVYSVLGGRAGAYGGYDQLAFLAQQKVVGPINWQTYAWSGGRWLPASIAPLEQYLNGNVFDNDRAIAADYGQWPYTAPKPPAPVTTTKTTPTPTPGPKPSPRHVRCWGAHQHRPPHQRACVLILKHHNWLVSRRAYWQSERRKSKCIGMSKASLRRNIRGCGHDLHWYALRRGQAVKYKEKRS